MLGRLASLITPLFRRLRLAQRRAHVASLERRGMKVGHNVVIMDGVRFDVTYPWLIEIRSGARISTNVRIMAHDATVFRDTGIARIGRVRILEDTFIGEHVIILPGVTIGPRAMVAAGSVVSRDIGEGVLAAGNPARVYGQYDELLLRTTEAAKGAMQISVHDIEKPETIRKVLAEMEAGGQIFVRDTEDEDLTNYYHFSAEELHGNAAAAYKKHFGDPPAR